MKNKGKKRIGILLILILMIAAIPLSGSGNNRAAAAETLGDINADGKIDPSDARLALRYAVSLEVPDAVQMAAADIDKDGIVTPSDARRILRTAVGLDDLLSSHSHSYQTEQIEATCTQEGRRKVTCEICGYVLSDQTLPAKGHSYTSQIIQEPTCVEDGKEEFTCVRCGDTYTETIYGKHNYVNYYCHTCDQFEYRKFSAFLWDYLNENGEYEEGVYYLTIDNASDYDVALMAGAKSDPVLVLFGSNDGELTVVTAVALADTNGHVLAFDTVIADSYTEEIYADVIVAATEEGSLEYAYEGPDELHDDAVDIALSNFDICFNEVYSFMQQEGYTIQVNADFGLPK